MYYIILLHYITIKPVSGSPPNYEQEPLSFIHLQHWVLFLKNRSQVIFQQYKILTQIFAFLNKNRLFRKKEEIRPYPFIKVRKIFKNNP